MRAAECVFAIGCGLWWALSLWVQIAPKNRHLAQLRCWDPIFLLHSYRFFAPYPHACDYFVEYRFVLEDDVETPWQPLSLYSKRSWSSLIWHPELLRKAALAGLAEWVVDVTTRRGQERAAHSGGMLALFRYIQALPRSANATAVQIKVFTGHSFAPEIQPADAFFSPWMRLGL